MPREFTGHRNIRASRKGAYWGEVRKRGQGGRFLKTTSCAIPQIQRRAKNHKGTKHPKKKGVKKEVFEEGSDRIRSGFWKDDAGSI